MGFNKHIGNRKPRGSKTLLPKLGYYLIITDTEETEKNYFDGLRESLPKDIQKNIVIKVINTKTDNLIAKAKEYLARESQYYQIWIVFDRDLVVNFDDIVRKAEKCDMKVGWSNPCFEIWLAAYWGTMPNWTTSVECCKGFEKLFLKKTKKEYAKNSKTLYQDLMQNGNEEKAVKLACNKLLEAQAKSNMPSEQYPATTVFKLIEEIRKKC